MTPEHAAHARSEGERRKDVGMALAACRLDRQARILVGQIAFLDTLRYDPERRATTDRLADDLLAKFADGGKWRGEITKGLARARLIRRVGYQESDRAARHRGTVAIWQAAVSDGELDAHRAALQRQLRVVEVFAILELNKADTPATQQQPTLF